MSATDGPRASMATPGIVQTGSRTEDGSAFERDHVGGLSQLRVRMKVVSLLTGYARRRAVTRTFGVPAENQSFLVTITLLGAVATVVGSVVARPWPHPSGTDLAIGGTVVNAGLRGLAGPPSSNVPLAGGLIAFAVLSRSLRPAAAASVRDIRRLAHGSRGVITAVLGYPSGNARAGHAQHEAPSRSGQGL
jgi:hypothetical protein